MHYALLIYEAEAVSTGYSELDEAEALAGHRAFQESTKRSGAFIEANQLMPPGTATSVRVRAGDVRVTDGPFVETKELLIGYYLVECADLDEAVELAARIPHARTGGVEVRPVAYFERDSANDVVWTK